jgi:hypothetical protein
MKHWKIIGLITLGVLLIAGVRVYFIWRERTAPMAQQAVPAERKVTADDLVQPRKLYIDDLKSAKALTSKSVWIQAGYQLDYYPYAGHHIDFAHLAGLLPSAQQLDVQDVIEAKAPKTEKSRIPAGDQQVFLIFKEPGDTKEYATPIGYAQGSDSKYYCDDVFFYDDPHQMYKHWPPDFWQAIDHHQAKPGMSELQVMMALGNVQQSDSSDYGNRTVHYDVGGKSFTVSFDKDKATTVQAN